MVAYCYLLNISCEQATWLFSYPKGDSSKCLYAVVCWVFFAYTLL
uniref:Uncharacterized protein n=1 Tax=Anguilla anguilla TaxID=7936 RepID=A0A0E9RBM7_ANGAN